MQTITLTSYRCEYCGWESVNPNTIRRHESVCSQNPANLDRIKDLAGKIFTDGMGTYAKILSASPGVIQCALIKEIQPERHAVIRITEYAGPVDLLGWAEPCEEDEARQAAGRVTGLVKKFLGGARCRADFRTASSVRSPIRSTWTASTVRTSPR